MTSSTQAESVVSAAKILEALTLGEKLAEKIALQKSERECLGVPETEFELVQENLHAKFNAACKVDFRKSNEEIEKTFSAYTAVQQPLDVVKACDECKVSPVTRQYLYTSYGIK